MNFNHSGGYTIKNKTIKHKIRRGGGPNNPLHQLQQHHALWASQQPLQQQHYQQQQQQQQQQHYQQQQQHYQQQQQYQQQLSPPPSDSGSIDRIVSENTITRNQFVSHKLYNLSRNLIKPYIKFLFKSNTPNVPNVPNSTSFAFNISPSSIEGNLNDIVQNSLLTIFTPFKVLVQGGKQKIIFNSDELEKLLGISNASDLSIYKLIYFLLNNDTQVPQRNPRTTALSTDCTPENLRERILPDNLIRAIIMYLKVYADLDNVFSICRSIIKYQHAYPIQKNQEIITNIDQCDDINLHKILAYLCATEDDGDNESYVNAL